MVTQSPLKQPKPKLAGEAPPTPEPPIVPPPSIPTLVYSYQGQWYVATSEGVKWLGGGAEGKAKAEAAETEAGHRPMTEEEEIAFTAARRRGVGISESLATISTAPPIKPEEPPIKPEEPPTEEPPSVTPPVEDFTGATLEEVAEVLGLTPEQVVATRPDIIEQFMPPPPMILPEDRALQRIFPEWFQPSEVFGIREADLSDYAREVIRGIESEDPGGFAASLYERGATEQDIRDILGGVGESEEYIEAIVNYVAFTRVVDAFSRVFPTVENVEEAVVWTLESEENFDETLNLIRRIGRNEDTENLLRSILVDADDELIGMIFGEVEGLPPSSRITPEGMEFVIEVEEDGVKVRKLALLKPDGTVWMQGKHIGNLNEETGMIEPERAWWEFPLMGIEWAFAPFALFGQAMFGPFEEEEIAERERELVGANVLDEMEELRTFLQAPPPKVDLRTPEGEAEWREYTDRLDKTRVRLAELERQRAAIMAKTALPGGEAFAEYRQKPFWQQLLAELPMWIAVAGGITIKGIRAALGRRAVQPGAVGVTAKIARAGLLPAEVVEAVPSLAIKYGIVIPVTKAVPAVNARLLETALAARIDKWLVTQGIRGDQANRIVQQFLKVNNRMFYNLAQKHHLARVHPKATAEATARAAADATFTEIEPLLFKAAGEVGVTTKAVVPKVPPVKPVAVPGVPAVGEVKEPWQMTQQEYIDDFLAKRKPTDKLLARTMAERLTMERQVHRNIIEKALREGKSIPLEVLTEYPDLKPPTVTKPPTLSEIQAAVREGVTGKELDALLAKGRAPAVTKPPVEAVPEVVPLTEALIKDGEALVAKAEAIAPTNASVIKFRELVEQAKIAIPEVQREILIKMEALEGEIRALIPEVIPPAVKPPVEVIPEERIIYTDKGIPVPPEETIPQGVVENIPMAKDIGVLERVRPTRKVFEKMGIGEIHKGIQESEVLVGEAKIAIQKKVGELFKPIAKERRHIVFREANEVGSQKGLTFDEKRAAQWIKKWADAWADKKNLPPDKRIKDYIPHLFEQEMIAQIKGTGIIPTELARLLSEKVPKKITDRFLKKRLGAVGWLEDPIAAVLAYDAVANRVLYYEPFLQKIAAIAEDANTPLAVRRYLKDFSRRMTGEPSKLDLEINTTIQEFAQKLSKLPGGEAFASFLSRGNPSGMAAYQFTSAIYTLWLGFKPTSAIRNLSQHTLIIAEVGPVAFADGIRLRFTAEGKAALAESLVLRSRKASFVPGIDDSFAAQWTDEFREVALWMFRMADKQNVSDAFLAGYSEAKRLFPEAGRELWIKRGDEVAADTQYLYTKMNSMALSQSSIGRVFSILTTWAENWMELMVKWVSRRPSQVYTEYAKQTGQAIPKKNWSQSYKAILMYMAIIGLGYAIKELTRLKAWEYTGLTSIRYLADIIGGEFPGLQAPGAIANMIAGFLTDDERRFKEGWNGFKSTFTPGIIRQLDAIASGDKDFLTLFFYLEGKDYKIRQLKEGWEKGWKEYPLFEDAAERLAYLKKHPEHAGWSDAKIRNQWREDNPLLEAQMFVTSKFTTLSTDEARAEVLRLIEKHNLDPELIDGYEKIFGIDTDIELTKLKKRIGNLEKFVAGEEAEYFTVGNYVSEINKMVKVQGRSKVQRDGNPFTVAILAAQDSFVQYDSLEEADARKLFRQQFPDVEAWLYLTGRIQSFENPNSATELLRLMEKYGIPPEGIRAFLDDPSKYDELFTQKFELQQKNYELDTEYENYSNTESPLYIDPDETIIVDEEEVNRLKYTRAKLKEDNPNWVADMRRIEAIDNDATPEIMEAWVDRGKTIDEFGAGSSEAMVFLLDNPEVHKWALDNKLLTDDGTDWNEPVLRINAKWQTNDEAYNALVTASERQEYLLGHDDYRKDRRRREAHGDGFLEDQVENFVEYWELPVKGFRQERMLLDDPDFAEAMHDIKGIDIPPSEDVPVVKYDDIYDQYSDLFDEVAGLSDNESEYYIEDVGDRKARLREIRFKTGTTIFSGITFNNVDRLTDFGKAEVERDAHYAIKSLKDNENYNSLIEAYVGYYTLDREGKPADWDKKTRQDFWFEDDWFMVEHMDFHNNVYVGVMGNEAWDFRKVPILNGKPDRALFEKWLAYNALDTRYDKDTYRLDNPDLDNWGVNVAGIWSTTMTERRRRLGISETERMEEEAREKHEEAERKKRELERRIEALE